MTETWAAENLYCPRCTNTVPVQLTSLPNNSKVADLICKLCGAEFELKSTADKFKQYVTDGQYHTMLKRLSQSNSPHFLFLAYDANSRIVKDVFGVPTHFLYPSLILPRKPLSDTAQRAGWQGCNIHLGGVPYSGRIVLVQQSVPVPHEHVCTNWSRSEFLKDRSMKSRGWTIEILALLDRLPKVFQLAQVYQFEIELRSKFPNNIHIKAKIRQQLQILREQGYVEFLGNGVYGKLG